jgi:peptide/nickel transport system permease protein
MPAMSSAEATTAAAPTRGRGLLRVARMLAADPFALAAFFFLVFMVLAAALGPILLPETSVRMNLQMRNAPPFVLENGIAYILGGDSLGRPILPRLLVAARTTLMIAVAVVICSATIGATLGLIAGYYGRWLGALIMRFADVVMSFPSLLLAVIVLYMLEPRAANVIIVLAITRMPVFIRVTRAEVLEIKERLFVEGARAAGASDLRIMTLHVMPIVVPTIFTVASLDFANVMLNESSLSFLGIGVQPPDVTWGLMVASGRNFLTTAWWLAFWPGLAILLTALAANLLSNWLRIAMDPKLRWRLERAPAESSDG